MSKVSRRNAFTLVELLVVIAIIGILVGLLLPAVQQIREAARRAQCQNNLKQLSLATHNYEAAYKKLPIGVKIPEIAAAQAISTYQSLEAFWSWSTYVLPYMEQQPTFDEFVVKANNSLGNQMDATNPVGNFVRVRELAATPIPAFLCPSDSSTSRTNKRRTNTGGRGAASRPITGTSAVTNGIYELAISNYGAATSSSVCYGSRSGKWGNAETLTIAPDGMFCSERALGMRDMRDGLSNTINLSERVYSTTRKGLEVRILNRVYETGAFTLYASRGIHNSQQPGFNATAGVNADVINFHGIADIGFCGFGGINKLDPAFRDRKFYGVSSRHSGGVNVARGDGSVEFLSETIIVENNGEDLIANYGPPNTIGPQDTYRQLLSLSDGNVAITNF